MGIYNGTTSDDTLSGSLGADTLVGDTGNDTYRVNHASDIIIETSTLATEIDLVISSFSYTLGNNLENLNLAGTTAIHGVGNQLDNRLIGNSAANRLSGGLGNDLLSGGDGADTLDGGQGADTLIGGTGNDTYCVDSVLDVVNEASTLASERDSVFSTVSYTLGVNLDNLTLQGNQALIATGNSNNNVLAGNNRANILDGRAGSDTMIGGAGNDTYYVDNILDETLESSTLPAEIDTVISTINIAPGSVLVEGGPQGPMPKTIVGLFANVENLTLVGNQATLGYGNALDNRIQGSDTTTALYGLSGNDVLLDDGGNDNLYGGAGDDKLSAGAGYDWLDGGTGADTMNGGTGDDRYFVDSTLDVIIETSALVAEIDTVVTTVTYSLVGTNLENVVLGGTDSINVTGNGRDNYLIGNNGFNFMYGGTGNDTLEGGGCTDVMYGGAGNDTYYVEVLEDMAVESSSSLTEIDTVYSNVNNYTLRDNLENLVLMPYAYNGRGNARSNYMTGSIFENYLFGDAGSDTLDGGMGHDTLEGGAGKDSLMGGMGNDVYLFDRASGADTIFENPEFWTSVDTLQFGNNIAKDQLWFSKAGDNLEVSIIGTAAKVVVQDWYVGSIHHIEVFKTVNGSVLSDAKIEGLVAEMAKLTPPVTGQTTLSQAQHQALDGVITATWT